MEKKIAAELEAHGLLATAERTQPRVPDYADLAKLTYLSCVIKESMRMHTVSTSHETVSMCWQVYSFDQIVIMRLFINFRKADFQICTAQCTAGSFQLTSCFLKISE